LNSAIDIFSLGLILVELLLHQPEPLAPPSRHRQSSFPTSPPQSHSPQSLRNLPLLSTYSPNRRSFIEQVVRLFGPLPQSYRAGKFWSDDFADDLFANGGTLLSQYLENENVDPDLIDFIMRMLTLDPDKRISARDALKHEWLVGPLLGYWAALGAEWTPIERSGHSWQRRKEVMREERETFESKSSLPESNVSSESVRKLPPMYDFSTIEDDDDGDCEEVSLVYTTSSPTKPLPFVGLQSKIIEPEEQV
jgi:serine/threonine protein kinase